VEAELESAHDLPTHWLAYEGVDAVILSPAAQRLTQLAADAPRLKALDEWIRMGGRLVFCVGSQPTKCSPTTRRSAFARAVAKSIPLKQSSVIALETYCEAARHAASSGPNCASSDDVQGSWKPRCRPAVVVRTARDSARFSSWPPIWIAAAGAMVGAVVVVGPTAGHAHERADESEEAAAMMHFGYNDLSASCAARSTVLPAYGWFLLARRRSDSDISADDRAGRLLLPPKSHRRMEWTWLSSRWLLLVCVGYGLAYRLKGNQVKAEPG